MKFRIAHLTDVNLDTAFFRAVATYLDPTRFELSMGCLAAPGTLQTEMRTRGVSSFALGLPLRSPRAVLSLAAFLHRERIDLLHAHCFLPTLWGLVAARLAGRRFVFTRHHSDHHQRLGRWLPVALDVWCARHANHVIAVSTATKRILVETEGVPGAQVTVVHNGIEPLTHGDPSQVAALRTALGLNPDHAVCLVPSRLHEEKGHTTLFQAIESVVESVGPMTVLLAGEGGYRSDLMALAKQKGLSETVRFLGRRSDVADLMLLADVVVVPSFAESFGFVALEAMSLGRPLVVSSAGGLPEVVSECGLVFPVGDTQALAAAIVATIKDPLRSRVRGEAGMQRARLFTAKAMVQGYEAVYERILRPGSVQKKLPFQEL